MEDEKEATRILIIGAGMTQSSDSAIASSKTRLSNFYVRLGRVVDCSGAADDAWTLKDTSDSCLTYTFFQQGARVTVYDQDAALDARPRDWNFGIYWAQIPLSECLQENLQQEVEDAQVDGHRAGPDEVMPIYNGQIEELLKAVPIPYNIHWHAEGFYDSSRGALISRYGRSRHC